MTSPHIGPNGFGPESALAYCMNNSSGQPLLKDHRFNPLHPSFLADIIRQIPDQLADDDMLTLTSSSVSDLMLEQWEVGVDDVRFIMEACRCCSEDDVETPIKQAFLQSLTRDLPQWELPLLPLTSQQEYHEMRCRLATVPLVSMVFHEIPTDDLDAVDCEGLEFPSSAYRYQETMEIALKEKLPVTQDTFCYLADVAKTDRADLNDDGILIQDFMPQARPIKQKICLTPPVTPRFTRGELEPWVPGSEGAEVSSPSKPRSLLSNDLNAVEAHIFETDSESHVQKLTATDCSPIKSTPPTSTPEGDLAIPIFHRKRIDDFTLDLPLIALKIDEPSEEASLVVNDLDSFLIHQDHDGEETESLTELLEIDISSQLQEAATKVSKRAEQEQLEPLDGLARIPVPVVDTTLPEADWNSVILEEKHMLAHIIGQHSDEFRLTKWKVDRRAERELPWLMSRSSGIALEKDYLEEVDESALQEFLGFNDDAIGTWILPSKTRTFAIFSENNHVDDEDLEATFAKTPSPIPPPATALPSPEDSEDLMSCVRQKRKALTDVECLPVEKRTRHREPGKAEQTLLMGGKSPEGIMLLSAFLELNGHSKTASLQSKYFQAGSNNETKPAIFHGKQSTDISQEGLSAGNNRPPINIPQQLEAKVYTDISMKAAKPAPVPCIKLTDFPLKFVISITLPRGLIRQLEMLLPGVGLIERDFDAYNYSTWAAGTSEPSTVMSSLAEEADITVSPGVGIILTATVNVRQEPIVGCGGDNILQRQVRKVSRRYERLVVLVSDKSLDDTILPMAPADELAFAEFQAFTQRLQDVASVNVYWVGGGQASLASWIASLATECASLDTAPFYKLLCQGESNWELFLRRAGMSTFAAQIICGLLQTPYKKEAAAVFGGSGLAAFVRMSANERAQRYMSVLGGRRVMDRVSEAIDQIWG